MTIQLFNVTIIDEVEQHVSGEQMFYLPKPKAEADISDLRNTDKSRYSITTEFNICSIVRSRSLFS